MIITFLMLIFGVWFWTKFVVMNKFPFLERVNQLLLGLMIAVVVQVFLSVLYLFLIIK